VGRHARGHFSARSCGVSVSLVASPFRSPRLMVFLFDPMTAIR
jgi:hypothetical protein